MPRSLLTPLSDLVLRTLPVGRLAKNRHGRNPLLVEPLEARQLLTGLSFSPPSLLPVGRFEVTAGDLNGDGNLDLVTTQDTSDDISWLVIYMGNGDGTYRTPVQFDTGVRCYGIGIELADLNHDNRLDVVMTHGGSTSRCFGNKLTVHLGDGAGGLESPGRVIETGGSVAHLAIADLNEDGNPDLAVPAADPSAIFLYLGTGDGAFRAGAVISTGGLIGGVTDILAQDLTGDGHVDLALAMEASGIVRVFSGSGAGTFTLSASLSVPGAMGVAAGDFYEDGIIDLAVISRSSGVARVFRGTGAGEFSGMPELAVAANLGAVTVADFNVDGHLDLALGSMTDTRIFVAVGDGGGNLLPPVAFDIGRRSGLYRIRAGDLNNDSLPDLVSVSEPITILRNTSFVAFGTSAMAIAGQRFAAIVSSFTDAGVPGTATDYVAYLDWGDGTDLGTGGVERTGTNTFDVAGSHRYAAAGEYWVTVTIIDARTWDRYAVAYTYVNVVPADEPGPGGGWNADLLAALDAIHGDPWKERQPDYAAFELLSV